MGEVGKGSGPGGAGAGGGKPDGGNSGGSRTEITLDEIKAAAEHAVTESAFATTRSSFDGLLDLRQAARHAVALRNVEGADHPDAIKAEAKARDLWAQSLKAEATRSKRRGPAKRGTTGRGGTVPGAARRGSKGGSF